MYEKCPYCGANVSPYDDRCLDCGADLLPAPAVPAPAVPPPAPPSVQAPVQPPGIGSAEGIAASITSWGDFFLLGYGLLGASAIVGGVADYKYNDRWETTAAGIMAWLGLIGTGLWIRALHHAGAEALRLLAHIAWGIHRRGK